MSGAAAGSGAGSAGGAALGGLGGSLEDKDCDLLCPVCFELIDEAYVTRCGHSFCYACIAKAVELQRRCPKCGAALASRDHIFPNFLLNELAAKRRLRNSEAAHPSGAADPSGADRLRALVAGEARRMALPDVEAMLEALARRKRLLEAESAAAQHRLLYEFLATLHRQRTARAAAAKREASLVRRDMLRVAAALKELDESAAGLGSLGESVAAAEGGAEAEEEEEAFAAVRGGGEALAGRWRRLAAHFEDFVECYFAHRADELYFPLDAPGAEGGEAGEGAEGASMVLDGERDADAVPQIPKDEPRTLSFDANSAASGDQRLPESVEAGEGAGAGPGAGEAAGRAFEASLASPADSLRGLEQFREDLASFTRYRALRPLATLSYSADAINYSTIVSTIEFDKDDELFAIAGVTKRIKVFDYAAVVRDAVDVHYPSVEMACSHKVSCVSWNGYHRHVLASSDYEGTVSLWDAARGTRTRALQEHDKRCWSVHFSRADCRLLASGSDDARVKLWALNCERSVATLEARFNVCCVRFNPRSSCHLAFGSADHCVHYYDLRAPRRPLCVFRDHRKAVSYVKFLDARSLVSASTDSQLKLWRVGSPRCVRSFRGHANEKNFVGLASDGRYVACGSEDNALYVYYAGVARPMLAHRFAAQRGLLERAGGERERRDADPAEFVSAVCWRRAPPDQPQVLLAANSQGTIKVLELV